MPFLLNTCTRPYPITENNGWQQRLLEQGVEREQEPEEVEEDEEEVDPEVPEPPVCPNCGWRNTRPSHTRTLLDTVLRTFSMRPYRCRSCGNRFRVIRRGSHG